MTLKKLGLNSLAISLSVLLCNVPSVVAQTTTSPQSTQSAPPQSPPDQVGTEQNTPADAAAATPQSQTVRPDPSQAPLAPVPSVRPADNNSVPPDAPSEVQRSQQQVQQTQTAPESQPAAQQRPSNPLGTAAAQQGATRGGVASKPAGEAIAPAKQHQVRSLLIKVGLVAAGAAAIGTVVGLTRGTSSVPPGAAAR
jgi:hypothetical protein